MKTETEGQYEREWDKNDLSKKKRKIDGQRKITGKRERESGDREREIDRERERER